MASGNNLVVPKLTSLANALMGDPGAFQVSYDLNIPGQNYGQIISRLQGWGAVRVQLSTWWVESHLNAFALRNDLLPLLDFNDSLLVVELAGDVAGYEQRENLRRWMTAVLARRRRAA